MVGYLTPSNAPWGGGDQNQYSSMNPPSGGVWGGFNQGGEWGFGGKRVLGGFDKTDGSLSVEGETDE